MEVYMAPTAVDVQHVMMEEAKQVTLVQVRVSLAIQQQVLNCVI
jgi:hypothetical protein